jgi:hypothetical protein
MRQRLPEDLDVAEGQPERLGEPLRIVLARSRLTEPRVRVAILRRLHGKGRSRLLRPIGSGGRHDLTRSPGFIWGCLAYPEARRNA